MRYVDEFRSGELARALAAELAETMPRDRELALMEVCGGHTHAIYKHGIDELLPAGLELVHGPGCPVCVIPVGRVDDAVSLALEPNVIFTTFGDMMRVPGSKGSLLDARSQGADVRMVYSPLDALELAREDPEREVIFFAIGFETTAPSTAVTLLQAQAQGIENFTIFCNHVTIGPPLKAILDAPELRLDGLIAPGHVSAVIGSRPYDFIAAEYGRPVVVAGFEPLDVAQAILMLVRQVNDGRHEVENQYIRAVSEYGNEKAQAEVAEVFELRERFEWRGLGEVPYGALRLRAAYERFDAERRFELVEKPARDNPACECGAILRGVKKPRDCKLFGTLCTPDTPMGSCMVSPEGACSAHWTYGRFREAAKAALRHEEVA
jgi:hydrogenase expression/formation protein HypD